MILITDNNTITRSTTFSWRAGLPWMRSAAQRTAGVRTVLKSIPAWTFDAEGHTALHAAAHAGDVNLVRTLCKNHPDLINARATIQTSTPLHAAVACPSISGALIRTLIDKGADPRARASLDVGNGAFDAKHLTPREIVEELINLFPSERERLNVICTALLLAEQRCDRQDMKSVCITQAPPCAKNSRRM